MQKYSLIRESWKNAQIGTTKACHHFFWAFSKSPVFLLIYSQKTRHLWDFDSFFLGGCQKNVLHDSAANCRTLSASTVVEPWRPPCTPGLFCCRWWELGMVQQATRWWPITRSETTWLWECCKKMVVSPGDSNLDLYIQKTLEVININLWKGPKKRSLWITWSFGILKD